jgi:hypothetical protein
MDFSTLTKAITALSFVNPGAVVNLHIEDPTAIFLAISTTWKWGGGVGGARAFFTLASGKTDGQAQNGAGRRDKVNGQMNGN